MANTLQLKRRIKTAQNVSKTTRAMQMIAASKMKRAQNSLLSGRPYIEKLSVLIKDISAKIDKESANSYFNKRGSQKTLLLVFSPDKGLCGGLISNLLKEYFSMNAEDGYVFLTVGKKMERNIARLGKELTASFPFGNTIPSYDMVFPIANIINDYYLGEKVGSVSILTTSFKTIFIQKPQIIPLLPITIGEQIEEQEKNSKNPYQLFEPDINTILPVLIKRYLETSIYHYLLEAYVAEQSARMIAMQNATDNAKDIIQELTLEYNKERQQKITREILDLSGAFLSV